MFDPLRTATLDGRPALLTADAALSYADLADRVEAVGARLGSHRRLILLAARNDPDTVALYLAALRGRHPLILVDADNREGIRSLEETYDPDVVAGPGWITERRSRTSHTLHPDLALLLSTSGSTGSPKLVRLSLANLRANAESISTFLGIGETDRAITSLPLAYCYGLSVLNSHLLRGASVVLTERSVIEPEFWRLFRRTRATSFAGVPYTFDLLDRVGFADMRLPTLRYVTQAGGRLDPSSVRRYADRGPRRGWDIYDMYGQTEATARMAYLPPDLAASRPESIGIPIPGGSFRVDPVPGLPPGSGELLYDGPNVMLGYAHGPADLAHGREVAELRTGDLARGGSDGLYEIVGRRSQFLKIAGLRIDPAAIERLVARHGARACVVGTDDQLVIFAEADAPADLPGIVRDVACLPAHAVRVVSLPELPRLPNGKVDRIALQARAASDRPAPGPAPVDVAEAVRARYAATFGAAELDDSFASIGGDSLSYVEISLGLEEVLGRLPDGWETMPIRRLATLAQDSVPRDRWWSFTGRWRSIEMSVALRALAILLVVGTHIGMITAAGGAHVLMAVAGFNFARFRLTTDERGQRVRAQLRATARIALPAMLWVAGVMLLTEEYELRHLFLVNALVNDQLWGNLWFIELLVYISLAMAALFALPAADRAERRWPFGFATAVLAVGLLFRFEIVDLGIPYTMPVLWLFALGWAASRATRSWQRGLVLGLAAVSIPGYFDSLERTLVILGGVALLIGVPRVRVPAALAPIGGILASASLYIYLVHWEIWPLFEGWYGVPSLVASVGAGIGLWLVASRLPAFLERVGPTIGPWMSPSGAFRRAPAGPPQ